MPTASQFKILAKIGCDGGGGGGNNAQQSGARPRSSASASAGTGSGAGVGTGAGAGATSRRQGATSARAFQLAGEEEFNSRPPVPVYIPPTTPHSLFGRHHLKGDPGGQQLHQGADTQPEGDRSFFPDMVSMATLVSKPGSGTEEELTADGIMKRLQDLGWRKEGDGLRYAEEQRRKEQERKLAEQEQLAQRREVLDLVNDPLLRRVKARNQQVVKHARAPERRPHAVCFDLTGPSVAHCYVKMQLDTLLAGIDDVDFKILTLEYQPRAMHIRDPNAANRWIITLDKLFAVTQVEGCKMAFGKQTVELKRYDDVMSLEYKAYTRQTNFKKQFEMS